METQRSIVTAARKCDLRRYKYRLLPLHGFAVFGGRRRGLGERFGLDRTDSVAFGVSERADRIDTTTVVNRRRGNRHRESRRGHAGSKGVHGFDVGGSSIRFEIELLSL